MVNKNISLTDIRKKLVSMKPYLQEKYDVKNIGIFGSFVRNENTEMSDLDILVEFNNPIGLLKFIDLKMTLSKLLGVKVDLVMKSSLKPIIGKKILDEVIYK